MLEVLVQCHNIKPYMVLSLSLFNVTNQYCTLHKPIVFFLISKKIILKKQKRTKTTQRIQRGEQKRKKKRKEKNRKQKHKKKPTKTNYKGEN